VRGGGGGESKGQEESYKEKEQAESMGYREVEEGKA